MAGVDQIARRGTPPLPKARLRAWDVFSAVAPYLAITALLAGWEAVAHSSLVTPFMLPSIESVMARVWGDIITGAAFVNLGATLYRALVGFAVAAVIGISLGLFMAQSRLVNWIFDPIISAGFPMPKVALLPIFILWFGLYDFSKIMLIIVNAVFPVVIATISGLRGVETELIWSARSMGASETRVRWGIVLPAALPEIFTGLQVALPVSLIVGIVAEMIMSGDGLGGAMIASARFLDSPSVFAGLVEIAVAGFLLVKAMELVRARVLVWHSETAGATVT